MSSSTRSSHPARACARRRLRSGRVTPAGHPCPSGHVTCQLRAPCYARDGPASPPTHRCARDPLGHAAPVRRCGVGVPDSRPAPSRAADRGCACAHRREAVPAAAAGSIHDPRGPHPVKPNHCGRNGQQGPSRRAEHMRAPIIRATLHSISSPTVAKRTISRVDRHTGRPPELGANLI